MSSDRLVISSFVDWDFYFRITDTLTKYEDGGTPVVQGIYPDPPAFSYLDRWIYVEGQGWNESAAEDFARDLSSGSVGILYGVVVGIENQKAFILRLSVIYDFQLLNKYPGMFLFNPVRRSV